MRILYFRVKKSLLRAKQIFPLQYSSTLVSKDSEFYADFRSEGIIQKKCTEKKIIPKTVFCYLPKLPEKNGFWVRLYFGAFYSEKFFQI